MIPQYHFGASQWSNLCWRNDQNETGCSSPGRQIRSSLLFVHCFRQAFVAAVGGDQLPDRQLAFEETVNIFLPHAIRAGYPFVLPQMFQPGFNKDRLQKTSWCRDILE
jgi:hypothetical protein